MNRPVIHPGVRIGHVHLKVADLERALRFYSYWDRPAGEWPRTSDGRLAMFTRPLDRGALLGERPGGGRLSTRERPAGAAEVRPRTEK